MRKPTIRIRFFEPEFGNEDLDILIAQIIDMMDYTQTQIVDSDIETSTEKNPN